MSGKFEPRSMQEVMESAGRQIINADTKLLVKTARVVAGEAYQEGWAACWETVKRHLSLGGGSSE